MNVMKLLPTKNQETQPASMLMLLQKMPDIAMTALDSIGDSPWHFYLLAVSPSPEQDGSRLKLSTKARKKRKALEPFSFVQS